MTSIPEDWKNHPYDDPFRHRRETLLSHKGRLDIPTLARLWLQDLASVGFHQIDCSSGAPPKEPPFYYPRAEPLHSDAVPIRPEGTRQVFWLKLNGRRMEQGYRSAEILDQPLDTDKAILAALTALEAKEIEPKGLDDSMIERVLDASKEEWPDLSEDEEAVRASEEEMIQALDDETIQALAEDVEKFRTIYDDPQIHAQHTLEYVVALLRHYRPEFDDLSREERLVLLTDGYKRTNAFLKALRQLMAFLEYGIPGNDLKSKVEDAASDIRAAELRAVEGLSNRAVGEVLGIEPTRSDLIKGENSKARQRADRGQNLLINNLGEEGWRKLVEAKRAQRDHYRSLSEEERGLGQFAEQEGLTLEQARSLIDEITRSWREPEE